MAAISITVANIVPSTNATYVVNNDSTPTKAYETVTQGQLAYKRAISTEGYGKCDATNADSNLNTPVGMFVSAALAGQPVAILKFDPLLAMGSILTLGKVYIAGGTTSGGFTSAVGAIHANADENTNVRKSVVGIAVSATQMYFSIIPFTSAAMA